MDMECDHYIIIIVYDYYLLLLIIIIIDMHKIQQGFIASRLQLNTLSLNHYSQDHVEMLANAETGEVVFFKARDDVFYPTLRLLHKCE